MQRRDMVKTSLFGIGAVAAAGIAETAAAAPAKKRTREEWDVVVVGAGFAGMCAALEAAEQGAKVVLLEKMGRPDGATVYSSGWIAAVGSRFQKNHPEDNKEAFFNDMMKLSGYHSDPELIRVYADEAGQGIDWLADHGLAAFHLEPYAGHTNTRAHRQETFKGRDYIDCLVKQLNERGLKIEHHRGLKRFFFDEKANRVLGVAVAGPDGKEITVEAKKGVIMATGGITGSPESLDRWVPSVAGKGVAIGGPSNDGEAMMIAVRDIGVPLSHMQYIASYPCGIVTHGRNGPYCRWWFITNHGGILVNKNGQRFGH